jgi:hypothetical protein
MAEDTYKGESPSKKMARAKYWRAVKREMGDRFHTTTHVVLASREGGDISALKAFGVADSNIVAVDRVQEAAEACAAKWPGIEVVHGDIADVVEKRKDRVGSVLIDFCGPICAETVLTGRRVLRALNYKSVFGWALLKGREQGDVVVNDGSPMCRRERRAMLASNRNHLKKAPNTFRVMTEMMATGKVSAKTLVSLSGEDVGDNMARVYAYLTAVHATRTDRWRGITEPKLLVLYQSQTATSRGVPMMMVMSVKHREDERGVNRAANPNVMKLNNMTDEMVRAYAVSEAADADPALLLNIKPSTVAAWKAHATRGTYDSEIKWTCPCPDCRPAPSEPETESPT